MSIRSASAMMMALAFSAPNLSSAVSLVPPAQSIEELGAAWLGESDGGEYCRLELDRFGRGKLAVQWRSGGRTDLYQIEGTKLAGYKVSFKLLSISGGEDLVLAGEATAIGMDLDIGSSNGNWKNKLRLEREESVLSRLRAVLEASQLKLDISRVQDAR